MGASSWPFVGRDTEVVTAVDTLRRNGALVVAGEAGVGKSRFARELAERDFGEGAPLVVSASASSREIPLGAFASILGPSDDSSAELPGLPGLPGLQRALGELRRRGPRGLVLVDDAHLLDGVSATLVGQLATERAVRLLLVVRSGEPAPDAVTALWKGGGIERTELGPLGERSTGRLLRAALGGPVAIPDERRLFEITRGNALWLRHLVEGERAAGRLTCVDGWWRWAGPGNLPPALRELVADRIGTLAPEHQRVLELVALAEPLGLGMLTGLAGAEAVEAVAQRELILVASEGSRWNVRLGHPLYGEEVRARMSVPRARRVRGELSGALAGTGSRRADDGLRRAVLDLGSDRPPDPDLLVGAAVQSAGLGDLPLAERLWRAACDAGGGARAHLGLGAVLAQLQRADEAIGVLAVAAAQTRGDEERVRLAATRANVLYFTAGRACEANAVLDEADAVAKGNGWPGLDGIRAAFAVSEGDLPSTRSHAHAVLTVTDPTDFSLTGAVWALGHARALSGRGEPLRPLVERGIRAAQRSPDTAALQVNVGFSEILDADLRGEPTAVEHRVRWIHSLTDTAVWPMIYDGRLARCTGSPRTVVRLMEAAVLHYPGHGSGWALWLHSVIAQCQGMLADADAARRSVERAESARHPTITMIDWELDLARGWAAAAQGAVREAVEHVRHGADDAGRRGMSAVEVLLRQTAVRFGDRAQSARLDQLHSGLGSTRSRLAAVHARALAGADAAELTAVSAQLEGAGMVLEAADAAAQAATTARTRGDLVTAARAKERARALARRGDDARTPAIRGAILPIPLSAREREVATLAANGLSNRAIAERLQLSVRTVESHVYRAYTRLGLPDRASLVAAVAPAAGGPTEVP